MSVIARHTTAPNLREVLAVAELFAGVFRRDVLSFYPQSVLEPIGHDGIPTSVHGGPNFQVFEPPGRQAGSHLEVGMFGLRYSLLPRPGTRFSTQDLRMLRAIGAVLSLRYHHLFQVAHFSRIELFRGGSEDHYVAAFVEPQAYAPATAKLSRIASTILTLRTAALSTYENRRVSTGALLIGPGEVPAVAPEEAPPDALDYVAELTSLKSIHRLCDGSRTLFLVDGEGKLADIVDIERWASEVEVGEAPEVPCPRVYASHARATRIGGHVCLVLSPNQEIKLFAGGLQSFVFAHGRWRILDPAAKFAVWEAATANARLARVLFQTALDLAESRHGGLLVVVNDPEQAVDRLIARHDMLETEAPEGPTRELSLGDPLANRALHYLARNRNATDMAPAVLESLAGLDGALATDRSGRLLAFGAILRHSASGMPNPITAEGARTTAALVASRFGPVLKVSEDGIISCFLNGSRVWDL
ncbi:hypothetical protein [Singulisphaera sp. PoT]|uniref:hypothetical protein n=1 Tax=Singulisphaera sp. PoT TaxID=3411797 RepID=UPI003BF4FF2B